MSKITTAIFPVGGLGTRFLPATKSMPKEMLPIANKPIIQYAFEEARLAGIERFIFVTGRNKNAINNHFDHSYELESVLDRDNKNQELSSVIDWLPQAGSICFVRQQQPLGLGHAIFCARNFVDQQQPFVVILADELLMPKQHNTLSKMIDLYQQKEVNANILGVDVIDKSETNKYGILQIDSNDRVINMIEKPNPNEAPSNIAIIGRYILQPQIFDYLAITPKGKGGEIQLTDAMQKMCQDYPFYYQKVNQPRFDCGSVLGYIEANIAFAVADNKINNQVQQLLKKYL
jgi:UTP--glucose-1-phosphate uridylyltransferase